MLNGISPTILPFSHQNIYIFFLFYFPQNFSPLSLIISVLFSLFLLSLIYYLLCTYPNTILLPTSTSHITMVHSFWRVAIRVLFCVMVFFFFCYDQCLKEEVGMAGFLGCSDWWWIWWRSMWVTGFCGSLGLVEIGVHGSLGLVELGVGHWVWWRSAHFRCLLFSEKPKSYRWIY